MDSIVFAALEEICSQGTNGLVLQSLWPNLHAALSSAGLDLSDGVKAAVWVNLLKTPGLEFQSRNVSRNADDPAIQSVEQCEKLNLKIVAAEHLRDSFVGLYDAKASAVTAVSAVQRRVLERLAIARTNGITQSQLCKEFGIKANNMFYVLRNLECRGLIVRQSSVVRTKEACNEGESKNSSIVSTNLIHLYRYGKHLGSQQKLEITKEDKPLDCLGNGDERGVAEDGGAGTKECGEEMLIKDYLPEMKTVCDKLEEANGKVMVVRDIKQDLGYQGYHGHKSWRNICNRLKDAGLVEEFDAEVNKKVVNCVRLLKKFSHNHFRPKTLGSGLEDPDAEQPVKSGKRGQITDQLVELPMEHQIYDMIDAEGSKGLTVIEVCQRLGISGKANYNRFLNMFSRFGMHLQAESHKRGMAYRVWTAKNFNRASANAFPDKSANVLNENGVPNRHVVYIDFHQNSGQTIQELDPSTLKPDNTTHGKMKNGEIEPQLPQVLPGDGECNQMLSCISNPQEFIHDKNDLVPDVEHDLGSKIIEANDVSSETSPLVLSKPQGSQRSRRRSLSLTAISAQTEQMMLEWLQKEKFLLRAEIHKWLESVDKEKGRMVDRRTVVRTLNRLQQEGRCKCIQVSVPAVSNCGRTSTKEVILYPSVQSLSPEILGQIHERMRSFDKQVRGHSLSRLNTDGKFPVLNDVQRTQNHVGSDVKAIKSEAMRANGFVLAKMIRAKLLHNFLWAYLCIPGQDDALSSGKHVYDLKHPHSSCKLLALDDAIKAMPLELFLQVVGSTQKFDDMIEKCKSGLHLSDLPVQEYKCLMDTQATGRLSWIIDILRRLKLIRLVSGHLEDGAELQHATLKHALELKPYIEEPSLVTPSSCSSFLDLRPKIRHDFILSSKEAVDVYWKTLEYCYAAADPAAALHSFPGSAVNEVFLSRSWSSSRVMTADQRAKLLKCVVTENPDKKLSFKDCEKIAKDLNLTLEQVLRVYYDKWLHRLNRFQGHSNGEGDDSEQMKSKSSYSRKRKRSSVARPSKHMKSNMAAGELGKQRLAQLSGSANQFTEESDLVINSSEEHNINMPAYQEDDDQGSVEALGLGEEQEEDCSSVSQLVFPGMKPTRQRRFLWTEKKDRQLVMQYVRHRAALGAKFHRVDWSSLPDLPGPPGPCGKRMASLKNDNKFRKAVMRLCNMLSQRYAKHLEKTASKLLNLDDCRQVRGSLAGLNKNLADGVEHADASNSEGERWDDFEDKNIKIALDEIIQFKWMSNVESLNEDAHKTTLTGTDVPKRRRRRRGTSGRRSRRRCLPRNFIKILNERIDVTRRAHESLAVSNAVELFKLVFLSTSTSPKVPNLLAETLRRYSEHDLISAFNYLRERKIMVGGSGSDPYVLSQQFLQSVSSSPFPADTGRRAAKFASWLHEREKDLTEEGINLSEDLQCGDIFHLFALVSVGELCLLPRLPDEGVGEADDSRTSKRKADSDEFSDANMIKKLKTSLVTEGEIVSRREKGFPGIMVSVSRATMSRTNVVDLFKDGKVCNVAFDCEENDQLHVASGKELDKSSSRSEDTKEIFDFCSVAPIAQIPSNSPWEAMMAYAQHLISIPPDEGQASPLSPELFKTVYTAIKKAGDQGFSMEEIFQVVKNLQGKEVAELVVEVLLAFGRVLKVNAYESVHFVDAFYRSKYFLISPTGFPADRLSPSKKPLSSSRGGQLILQPDGRITDDDNPHIERRNETDDVHKVTILNIPEEHSQPSSDIQLNSQLESCMEDRDAFLGGNIKDQTLAYSSADCRSCSPMLPWMNGDGSINRIVYKGLTRRILGTVMQNPGILEADIIRQMDILNPQSCRKLLELLILDNHLIVRKMHQTAGSSPPALLGGLLGSSFAKPKSIFREHYFANPLSATSL